VEAGASVVYYFNEENGVAVLDGIGGGAGAWKNYSLPVYDDWRRVTIQSNYATQTFKLYLDGRLMTESLGFAFNQPFYSRFTVRGSTYLDDLLISIDEPVGLDNDWDGLSNAEEAVLGTNPNNFDTDGDGLADSL